MAPNDMKVPHRFLLFGLVLLCTKATLSRPPSSGSCFQSCGSIEIPYPFGTSPDCAYDSSFLLTCKNSQKLFFPESNVSILNISVRDGELRVEGPVARDCYDQQGKKITNSSSSDKWMLTNSMFRLSFKRNIFAAVGCDTLAAIEGVKGTKDTAICYSKCSQSYVVKNGFCFGIGCCKMNIPEEVVDFHLIAASVNRHTDVFSFNPCSYGFVVEDLAYNFSTVDLGNFQNRETVPVVLDWAVGSLTCEQAQQNRTSFACKASKSKCLNSTNGPGYRCTCLEGFEGNPYLDHGCKDINDGEKSEKTLSIALGISIVLLLLVLAGSWINWNLKKRKLIQMNEKLFQQNGGLILQQELSRQRGSAESIRNFTAEELKKATNNYDETRVLGQGGYGTVYKGVLTDEKVVAIKKSKIGNQSQIEQFINEVVVLSQINHQNVVKLLGCCLETEVPLLVYEFIKNGTLSDHVHEKNIHSSLPWERRLKIGSEIAGAIAYLHSSIVMPIIHGDIKSTNILLDENYTAKVADLGASSLIPLDQTQLTTLVQGTLGYLDPEYFQTSQLTEKSDVYSFGVVLAELLTGKKAFSFDRQECDRNLAMHFISSVKEERFLQILDQNLIIDGNVEQLKAVANVAMSCLRLRGADRPTMNEVAGKLEGLNNKGVHSWKKDHDLLRSEEIEYLFELSLFSVEEGRNGGSSSISKGRFDI